MEGIKITGVSCWEGESYVVLVDGEPVGGTQSERDAKLIAEWLGGNLSDVIKLAARAAVRRAQNMKPGGEDGNQKM